GRRFRDWRMTTRYELCEMYALRAAIGGFANYSYWCSTEVDFSNAWVRDFTNGNQNGGNKGLVSYVRAVRAF
ncbi:MAG: hypothetical protein ACO2Z9_07835, partial [Crocinitomicaceae bacterium]